MNDSVTKFMQAVLGDDAAGALAKAGERSEALSSVLGPRCIVGWLSFATRWPYDGEVPGLDGSRLTFAKSEAGLYDGTIEVAGTAYDFENADTQHLAAAMTVALGANQPVSKALRDQDLVALGQNIDMLVQVRAVQMMKALKESTACGDCGGKQYVVKHVCKHQKQGQCGCKKCSSSMSKVEPPGRAAAPKAPEGPQEPQAPTATQPKQQQPARPGQMKVTKSMSERRCTVCEVPQYNKRGEFVGCFCLRDLARFAKSQPEGEGFVISFDQNWTPGNLKLLADIMGEES